MKRFVIRLGVDVSLVFVGATLVILVLVGVGTYELIQHVANSKPSPAAPISIIPPPVGGHPRGDAPWFLVVGDSISAGVYPGSLGAQENPSFVSGVEASLKARGNAWEPDDLACPGETTRSYVSGCSMAWTNPLLSGKPQERVALADVRGHPATLRFILVELGANDILSFTGDPHWMADTGTLLMRLQGIVESLKAAAPGVPLLMANVYDPYAVTQPATVAQAAYVNGGMAELAQVEGVTLVDFATAMGTVGSPSKAALCQLVDCQAQGIHPTAKGAERLTEATMGALAESGVFPSPSPSPSPSALAQAQGGATVSEMMLDLPDDHPPLRVRAPGPVT